MDWLADLREAEPDAAAVIPEFEEPDDLVEEDWHRLYLRAWRILRFDRQYGSFGGESHICFRAINAYGRRYGFTGQDFDLLRHCVIEIDREWLDFVAEEQDEGKTK
ncbi:phage tail assembly chaperone [Xanthobacter aminoxidans]|uniref:phage tail assembly chaperone n=1 Tax=Xanthobacter aminoxidans TaxID=186280 RepID=UPI002022F0F5|nr:hypothetical protein [Xanthobacter aminoxidans]MCL8382051.1 hypothetical protein [Xanthobacter aminoxidans]